MNRITITVPIFLAVFGLCTFGCASFSTQGEEHYYNWTYTDLDGTALSSSGTVLQSLINASQEWRAHGRFFGIATGRSFEQARPAIQQLNPNCPLVLFNGAMLADENGQNIRILGHLNTADLLLCLNAISGSQDIVGIILHYPVVAVPDRQTEALKRFAEMGHTTLTPRSDIFAASTDSLIKLLIVCRDSISTENVESHLQRLALQNTYPLVTTKFTVEIMPNGCSKGTALKYIAKENKLDLTRLVVFGDNLNDVSSFSASEGLSCAVANGHRDAIAAADLLLANNDSDAISRVLRWLLKKH
jgi:Cof subfamily protein (haloacid dehalogenase superfamily)